MNLSHGSAIPSRTQDPRIQPFPTSINGFLDPWIHTNPHHQYDGLIAPTLHDNPQVKQLQWQVSQCWASASEAWQERVGAGRAEARAAVSALEAAAGKLQRGLEQREAELAACREALEAAKRVRPKYETWSLGQIRPPACNSCCST